MFSPDDIAEYYNTTQIHYEKWWKLGKNLSLHYGIWDKGTRNFSESLNNTNRILMELSNIQDSEVVLDAGCGVGGAALYLAGKKDVRVTGITLSEMQVKYASLRGKENKLDHRVSFLLIDYTKTPFPDESFDVVWACESISSAPVKSEFIRESYRVLKKGGRLILSDFYLTSDNLNDKNGWIEKWCRTWSMADLVTSEFFVNNLVDHKFRVVENIDFTPKILPSARRLYFASLSGWLPSELYNLFHPNVSRFARKHYMSGYYQYKALVENLWQYRIMLAVK